VLLLAFPLERMGFLLLRMLLPEQRLLLLAPLLH